MNSPLCDLGGVKIVSRTGREDELFYHTLSGRLCSGICRAFALGPIVDVVRLRDSLEDSTASHLSLTCHRNDGQGHGLSTLCNINAILRSSRIAMTTEFLVPLAPVRHSLARKILGQRLGGSSSPTPFHGHVHMLFDTFSPMLP
jgi:hypothetical protein